VVHRDHLKVKVQGHGRKMFPLDWKWNCRKPFWRLRRKSDL